MRKRTNLSPEQINKYCAEFTRIYSREFVEDVTKPDCTMGQFQQKQDDDIRELKAGMLKLGFSSDNIEYIEEEYKVRKFYRDYPGAKEEIEKSPGYLQKISIGLIIASKDRGDFAKIEVTSIIKDVVEQSCDMFKRLKLCTTISTTASIDLGLLGVLHSAPLYIKVFCIGATSLCGYLLYNSINNPKMPETQYVEPSLEKVVYQYIQLNDTHRATYQQLQQENYLLK